jgi:hypothetical protein
LSRKALIALAADNIIAFFKSKKVPSSLIEGKQELKRRDFCLHKNVKSVTRKVQKYEYNEEITAASGRS